MQRFKRFFYKRFGKGRRQRRQEQERADDTNSSNNAWRPLLDEHENYDDDLDDDYDADRVHCSTHSRLSRGRSEEYLSVFDEDRLADNRTNDVSRGVVRKRPRSKLGTKIRTLTANTKGHRYYLIDDSELVKANEKDHFDVADNNDGYSSISLSSHSSSISDR